MSIKTRKYLMIFSLCAVASALYGTAAYRVEQTRMQLCDQLSSGPMCSAYRQFQRVALSPACWRFNVGAGKPAPT
jgi:hypothetical protein